MRLVINYKIQEQGRDFGKTFVLTEMSAAAGEAWAVRALLALMANDVQLPEGFEKLGMAGMAEVGIRALSGLKWDVVEPLLAEMFQCVQFMPDSSRPNIIRDLIEEDIEEISTRIKLRAEIWKMHAGFLKAVANQKQDEAQAPVAG